MNKFKYIELTSEEINALKPIYSKKCCPKKCHTGERRLWFIPKKLTFHMKNLDYTCCSYCYYNKNNMNILDGKYKKEELVGILCEGLECNCDESDITDIESVSHKLSDGFLLSLYESGNNSKFLEINKVNDNIFNIYFDKMYTENISIILYKLIKKENDENEEEEDLDLSSKIMYAKIKENINNSGEDLSLLNVAKIYLYNNEFCMTLNKTINITKGNIQHKEIIYKPLKINFQHLNKQTITIEYSCSINLQNKNIIEINFINNNTNKYINTPKYKMKKLFI
jgi:hypothetical protein